MQSVPPAGSPPTAVLAVRPERPPDEPLIRALHEASFPSPFEGRLVDALRAAGRLAISLVAEEAGAVIGHIAFSPVSAGSARTGVGLAPVAVAPARRRRGVGARLVRQGLEACARAGFGFVVVPGDPAYYARFGFRPASGWGLLDEYGGGAAFQALPLRGGTITVGAGLVRYAPEFTLPGVAPDPA